MDPRHFRFNIVGLAVLPLLALVVAVGLAAWALWSPLGGSPPAQANPVAFTIDKTCSNIYGIPEAAVGDWVFYDYTITNHSGETLTRVSVIDDPLGDLTGDFPTILSDGDSLTRRVFHLVSESDPRPLVNEVTARYKTAGDTEVTATDTCRIDVLHLTVVKTASLSPGGPLVGEFTFAFDVTNDGSVPLTRFSVLDTTLDNITYAFPEELAIGQTATVTLTKLQLPKDPLCNTVTFFYGHLLPDGSLVGVKGITTACVEEKGSLTLTKFKEVGPFTVPTLVCFRLDPVDPVGDGQCKVPDADGNATFTWTDLTPGDYSIVETKEVCEVKGVEEDPCTRYALLDPIPVTMPDPPEAIVIPPPPGKIENLLQPGEICFEKRNPDGSLWSGGQGDVTFKVTSLSDSSYPEQVHLIASEGNPICKPVPEGTYKICETPPPDHTVSPSECQTVDALSGQLATVTVTFVNTPEDGDEGCTPGFWKNKKNGRTYWDEATDAIPIAIGAALGIDPALVAAIDPDSDFYAVFDVAPGTAGLPDPFTTDDAIRAKGGNPNKLVRHGMAALLNAASVNYPLGITEVKNLVQDALVTGNFEPLATDLDKFNNLGGDCGGNRAGEVQQLGRRLPRR